MSTLIRTTTGIPIEDTMVLDTPEEIMKNTKENILAGTLALKNITNGIRFGVDDKGKYGYIKNGETNVHPFNNNLDLVSKKLSSLGVNTSGNADSNTICDNIDMMANDRYHQGIIDGSSTINKNSNNYKAGYDSGATVGFDTSRTRTVMEIFKDSSSNYIVSGESSISFLGTELWLPFNQRENPENEQYQSQVLKLKFNRSGNYRFLYYLANDYEYFHVNYGSEGFSILNDINAASYLFTTLNDYSRYSKPFNTRWLFTSDVLYADPGEIWYFVPLEDMGIYSKLKYMTIYNDSYLMIEYVV